MVADKIKDLAQLMGLFALCCGLVIVGTVLIIRLAWS